MALGIVLIFVSLFIAVLYIEIRKFFINRKMRNFELLNGAPFIGMIVRCFYHSSFDINNLIFKIFDGAKTATFRFWAGPILVFGVIDPKIVEILLTHESSMNKPFVYEYIHSNTSIIVADKELWKPNRRALNPAFSTSVLANYIPHVNEKSRILIKRMQPHLNAPGDLFRTISVCLMDITFITIFGIDMNVQSELGDNFYEIEKKILNSIQYRFLRVWFRYDWIFHNFSKVGREERRLMKYANDMIEQIYDQKVEELKLYRNDEQERGTNFLEKCLALERQGILSHKNVLDELRVALIAGVDSSSIAIFAALLMLAMNQQHQDLVVAELRSVFESADCEVTQTHLAAMNYTERVIKESMRFLPPIPFMARRTTDDIEMANGVVPKDTIAIISILHMQRNPQVWGENVLEFDPDRFLPENIEKRPSFSYIPFSTGPRNCIGMKYSMMLVKTVLAHLLRKYKFTTDVKFDEIKIFMHIVLDIVIDKPLRIQKRNF